MTIGAGNFMLQLGKYRFSVNTASFEKLNYATTYRWVEKEAPTSKSPPKMQYNGPGESTLSIEGTIFPQLVKNGLRQVDDMRKEAEKGQQFKLVYVKAAKNGSKQAGVGQILGTWCIYSISEDRTLFLADGNPREIHFSMQLKAFDSRK